MSTEICLANLARRDWLTDGPLNGFVTLYIDSLRDHRYSDRTIRGYLGCLAHFSYWIKNEDLELLILDASLIERFLLTHLAVCTCPAPSYCTAANSGAALRHLLRMLPLEQTASVVVDPIALELERFGDYLSNVCGIAPNTRDSRLQHVASFLVKEFGTRQPDISELSAAHLDKFFDELSSRLRPSSLRLFCSSLRSYFRYRAMLGDSVETLSADLPRIADWRRSTLPKVLTDAEQEAFLKAFDCADPVGLRDYAIARCFLDLGLRGHEVTFLALGSVDWRNARLTISSTKSQRVQQLPLPATTSDAIAQYLCHGRPKTVNRALFVRHRAPFDKPLSVPAIRNSMNRAFVRCGLRDQFCNTHVLRRTTATRLQRSGASVKEIADLLRHQSLDTASTYARIDLEALRAVALPWPGSSL